MRKYDPNKWQEHKYDEYLQEKYGENWKLAKRAVLEAPKPVDSRPHSFPELLDKKIQVQPLPTDPLLNRI